MDQFHFQHYEKLGYNTVCLLNNIGQYDELN